MIDVMKIKGGRVWERLNDGTLATFEVGPFLRGYLECALWSSTDDADATHEIEDFAPEFLSQAVEDCMDFERDNKEDLARYYAAGFTVDHAGYDFWLTRSGHGAGFWDRGLEEVGERLSDACKPYGNIDLYVGDDGKVYGS